LLLYTAVRRRESGILPVTFEKVISSSKGKFLPHTISLSRDAATIYFDDDITTYKEHKLPLSTLWRHTVRAVADHQLQFQATAALPAGKQPSAPEMVWTILGKENLLRPPRIETRIVQPVDLSLHIILKFFVLNYTTLCKSRELRNGDRVHYPNLDVRRVRSWQGCDICCVSPPNPLSLPVCRPKISPARN
jgi:hypothetical protein